MPHAKPSFMAEVSRSGRWGVSGGRCSVIDAGQVLAQLTWIPSTSGALLGPWGIHLTVEGYFYKPFYVLRL